MAILPRQRVVLAGLDPSTLANADAGGDQFNNLVAASEKTFLRVINGGGGAITVTIASNELCSQGFTHDPAVSVPAGEERWIGALDRDRFNDADGNVNITYSSVTSVQVQVVGVP